MRVTKDITQLTPLMLRRAKQPREPFPWRGICVALIIGSVAGVLAVAWVW